MDIRDEKLEREVTGMVLGLGAHEPKRKGSLTFEVLSIRRQAKNIGVIDLLRILKTRVRIKKYTYLL